MEAHRAGLRRLWDGRMVETTARVCAKGEALHALIREIACCPRYLRYHDPDALSGLAG